MVYYLFWSSLAVGTAGFYFGLTKRSLETVIVAAIVLVFTLCCLLAILDLNRSY